MKKRIRIQGVLIFLAVIATIFYAKYLFVDPGKRQADWLWDILGISMILWGYLFRISARGFKAEMNPDGKTLVTAGPYVLIRNPMYFGTLLIGLGIIAVLFKWWVAFLFLAVYLIIYIPQINQEEAKLLSFFGDKFKDYCRKTPKYFPKPGGLLGASSSDYLRLKITWIKKELFSLILILIFVMGLKIRLIIRAS